MEKRFDSENFQSAVRYNGTPLDTSPTGQVRSAPSCFVGCDWLEFSAKGNLHIDYEQEQQELEDAPQIALLRLEGGTRHYKYRHQLYYDGILIAQINSKPHENSLLDKTLCNIKIHNEALYNYGSDLLHDMFASLEALRIKVNNFTRVDLFIDSPENQVFKIPPSELSQSLGKTIKFFGRGLPVSEYRNNDSQVMGWQAGKRTGSRMYRSYNKTLEIETSGKQYISKIHDQLFQDQQVWRFEVQLNSTFFIDRPNIEFLDLFNSNCIDIIRSACSRHFEFVTNTGKIRTDRECFVQFIDFDFIKPVWGKVAEYVKRKLKPLVLRVRTNLITARNLFRYYIFSSQKDYKALFDCLRVLDASNLRFQFEKRLERYVKEFIRESPTLVKFEPDKFYTQCQYYDPEVQSYQNLISL